ncbi:hypothetical protein UG53_08100 [Vibrio sp. S512-13]|nr:hypothetical protein [Vibrio parahaemolyticus]KJQ87436.1 hypothetical protein UG53_07805 [Vibrio sp. S512-13]KJQ87485.1 hypothetical protein UG53_08100 [Vibrio sp. S512-13]
MCQSVSMFESVMNTQCQALEKMMTNQDTCNPQLMEEAKQLLEEANIKAIQAAKQTTTTQNEVA